MNKEVPILRLDSMSETESQALSPADSRQILTDQLARTWSLRINQDQVLWRIFGAFWPTNAILLVALFRSGAQEPSRSLGLITCLAGIFVSVVWFLLHSRALSLLFRYDEIAGNLERKLGLKPDQAITFGLSNVPVRHGLRGRSVMLACILTLGSCWLFGLIWFLI